MQRKTIIYIMLSFILGSALTAFSASTLPPVYHLMDEIYVYVNNQFEPLTEYLHFLPDNKIVLNGTVYINGSLNVSKELNITTISVENICMGSECKASWSEVGGNTCRIPPVSSMVVRVEKGVYSTTIQVNTDPGAPSPVNVYLFKPFYLSSDESMLHFIGCPFQWDKSANIISMTGEDLGNVIFQSDKYENIFYGNCGNIACDGVVDAKRGAYTSPYSICYSDGCWASVTYKLPSPKKIVYFYGRGHADDCCGGCDVSGTIKFQANFTSDNQWHELCSCSGSGHDIAICSCTWSGNVEVSGFRVLGTGYDESCNRVKPYELVAWSPVNITG